MRESQRGLFVNMQMRGMCKGRGLGASVRHTLYCSYVLRGEPDPQQIAGVWCDLAAALFGAFTDKDTEREEDNRGGEKCVCVCVWGVRIEKYS